MIGICESVALFRTFIFVGPFVPRDIITGKTFVPMASTNQQ